MNNEKERSMSPQKKNWMQRTKNEWAIEIEEKITITLAFLTFNCVFSQKLCLSFFSFPLNSYLICHEHRHTLSSKPNNFQRNIHKIIAQIDYKHFLSQLSFGLGPPLKRWSYMPKAITRNEKDQKILRILCEGSWLSSCSRL